MAQSATYFKLVCLISTVASQVVLAGSLEIKVFTIKCFPMWVAFHCAGLCNVLCHIFSDSGSSVRNNIGEQFYNFASKREYRLSSLDVESLSPGFHGPVSLACYV